MKLSLLARISAVAIMTCAGMFDTFGQQLDTWRSIADKRGEFAIHIPQDMIVINENDDFPRFILSTQDVRLDITIRSNPDKRDISLSSPARRRGETSETTFAIGNVVGRVGLVELKDRFGTVINASSSKRIYTVSAFARTNDNPKVLRFLASIKFDGKPLLTIANTPTEPPAKATLIEDLESSDIVREFLAMPVNKKVEVRFESLDPLVPLALDPNTDRVESNPDETRSLIILEMPKPAYSPLSSSRVNGTVMVQVTLLGTGQVGLVVVDPKLDRGLAQSSADAAKRIKFIPAMVNGKPVDVRRRFVYSFYSR